jgi:hypothetical protein
MYPDSAGVTAITYFIGNPALLASSLISPINFHPGRPSAVFIASIPVLSIKRAVLSRFFPFAW